MDEVIFRSTQKLETLQVQLSLATAHSKELIQQCSDRSRSALLAAWNSSHTEELRSHVRECLVYVAALGERVRDKIWMHVDLERLYYSLVKVFWRKWTKRDAYFLGAGFVCGGLFGAMVAVQMRRKERTIRYMQAVQCLNYLGVESATVIENAPAPFECRDYEVLINVKAASVNLIDAKICSGYGRTLRRILQKVYDENHDELPVTLGRDCTGIVTDVGAKVRRVEIGEEVWLTVPHWAPGTLSQSYRISELRLGRKPKNVGFEGACSLPYAGSVALGALRRLGLDARTAPGKSVLVVGCCTPAGCVLAQVLGRWGAQVTAACYRRAAPVAKALGVADLLLFPEPADDGGWGAFLKEVALRDAFDAIVVTRECGVTPAELGRFTRGKVVCTLPEALDSDRRGFVGRMVYERYIRWTCFLERMFGGSGDYDEAHMCYMTLNELAEMVENGSLQTVVDKVFRPEDIEIALNHVQSPESIGSSVITFR